MVGFSEYSAQISECEVSADNEAWDCSSHNHPHTNYGHRVFILLTMYCLMSFTI